MALTPGTPRACSTSMLRIRAWGCGLRRIFPQSVPGKLTSAAYIVRPLTLSGPSAREIGTPTTVKLTIFGYLNGFFSRLRTSCQHPRDPLLTSPPSRGRKERGLRYEGRFCVLISLRASIVRQTVSVKSEKHEIWTSERVSPPHRLFGQLLLHWRYGLGKKYYRRRRAISRPDFRNQAHRRPWHQDRGAG